ncbi:uncharacterized protein [Temnothorax nylanderi]|uniref:uncharacterized protein n=1 Tax=Temnothorax nylanderi TaxID=102681 RepID=UPI003A88CFE6
MAANSLARLLPNIVGAGGHVRRLYVQTVHSVMLYGAPVWADEVARDGHRLRSQLTAVQRLMAGRAARTYQTVSHTAATVFAGIPPNHLIALTHAETYRRIRQI